MVTMSEDAYMGEIQVESGQGMTSEQVVAGLQSTRAFCLNAITGDPLARLIRGPVMWDDVSTRGTTTPVEFTAETLAVLMTEAIALVERLEHEVTTLRRALGVPLGETLPTWVQRYAESAPETTTRARTPRVGDVCTDRLGVPWQVREIRDDGTVVLHGDGDHSLRYELAFVVRHWGPLTWNAPEAADAPESDEQEAAGAPQPGDMCTDRDGRRWVVSWTQTDGVPVIRRTDGPQGGPLSDMEELSGPMVWDTPEPVSARESDGETSPGTPTPEDGCYAAYAASMDAEDHASGEAMRVRRRIGTDVPEGPEGDTAPWVPSVGDVCTDRDGDMWKVSRVSTVYGPMLINDSGLLNESMSEVTRQWGPLKWGNGQITDGS